VTRLATLASLTALAWTFCASGAAAESFHIQRDEQTKVQFVSDAPLEVITGSTRETIKPRLASVVSRRCSFANPAAPQRRASGASSPSA
jgi:hypothetical protein